MLKNFLYFRWKLLGDGLTFERQEVTYNSKTVFATFFTYFLHIRARSSFGLYSVHLALSKRDGMAVSSNYWGASVAAYALEGELLLLAFFFRFGKCVLVLGLFQARILGRRDFPKKSQIRHTCSIAIKFLETNKK